MHRRTGFGLALAALLVSATAALAGTSVTVPARAGWVSTGITVTAGQTVTLRTLGYVHTAPIPDFHVPGEFKSASGPGGQTTNPTCGEIETTLPPEVLEQTGPCAEDEAYFGELVGRIGSTTFVIGDARSFVAPASGTLELAANDLVLTLFDNTGAFTVQFR